MTELLQAEVLRRLVVLEARLDLLTRVVAGAVNHAEAADKQAAAERECDCPCTPAWKQTSTGGAL